MKYMIISLVIAATTMMACNNNTSRTNENVRNDSNSTMPGSAPIYACPMHPEIIGNKGDKCPKCDMELTELSKETSQTTKPASESTTNSSISEIVSSYLQVKNALVADNSKAAAKAAATLQNSFSSFSKSGLNTTQQKVYDDVKVDAIEHAEHISTNAGKIEHQREHFDLLSMDVYDMIKAVNSGQTLYKNFCPMYNNNKGAYWLSESKEIKNPYYGKAMLKCGTVKEEIK